MTPGAPGPGGGATPDAAGPATGASARDGLTRRELVGAAGAGALAAGALAAPAFGAGRRPNVLILMTDQERHPDRLPPLPTPVRSWIDANGVRLDRFHASSMACSPSRACFWTGMYAPQQGIFGTFLIGSQFTLDPSIPAIGDLFKKLGYRTAFFGKWHLSPPGDPPTNLEALLDTLGNSPLRGYGFDHSSIGPPSDHNLYNDGFVNDPIWTAQALRFLRDHAGDERPWLCVLSLLNPHDIQFYPRYFQVDFQRPDYDPQVDFSFHAERSFADKPTAHQGFRDVISLIAGSNDRNFADPAYWRDLLNTYYDLIVGTDDMLGAVVKEVADQGALDDTVIVRTADHGELGGAHRLQGKGITIYDEQNRVPFTVVYPRRLPRGARSAALGEAVDLAPTLLELAGEPDPVGRWPWLRGVSLVPALEDPAAAGPRNSILFRCDEQSPLQSFGVQGPARTHVRSLFDGRYKIGRYVEIAGGGYSGRERRGHQELEVYDTWEDPFEIRNLANDAGYEALTQDLLAWLAEREEEKFAPLRLPAFGPRPPISRLPDLPNLGLPPGGLPVNPWFWTRPGGYLEVPVRHPQPLAFLYDGRPPRRLRRRQPSAAERRRAEEVARFFCALDP